MLINNTTTSTVICVALVWLSLATMVSALTRGWKDAVSGQWGDVNRWSPAGMLVSGDDIVITSSGAFTGAMDASVSCRTLLLGAKAGRKA